MYFSKSIGRRLSLVILLALISVFLMVRVWTLPEVLGVLDQMPETCPLKRGLHLKCAFCGMTHAWIRIFFGDWRGATTDNLLAIPVFLSTLTMLGYGMSGLRWGSTVPSRRWITGVGILVLTIYALARNF